MLPTAPPRAAQPSEPAPAVRASQPGPTPGPATAPTTPALCSDTPVVGAVQAGEVRLVGLAGGGVAVGGLRVPGGIGQGLDVAARIVAVVGFLLAAVGVELGLGQPVAPRRVLVLLLVPGIRRVLLGEEFVG